MKSLQDARESFEALRLADKSRYDFVELLLQRMETVASEKAEVEEKLKESEYTRACYRRDLESSENELSILKGSFAKNRFILVLIDGDAAPFRDEFIQQRVSGGESAARELRRSVIDYVTTNLSITSDFEVMIRIYSKMQYLNRTYHDADILKEEHTLQEFVQGFNRVDPFCEYDDAGNDKEGADRKVQSSMKLFFDNVHCKHVILCAPEKSYTGFLRSFVNNGEVCDRVTLVESIPFPQCLAELSTQYCKTRFPKVFRDAKIVTENPTKTRRDRPDADTQGCTYASTVSGGMTTPTRPNYPQADAGQILRTIQVNAKGQRVDPKLPHYDGNIVTALKDRKLCNRHFLSYCTYAGRCAFDHNASLNPSEVTALRFIARLSACENGVDCRDSNCVASHMCRYGSKCKNSANCRYPLFMHGLDSTPAATVPARS